MSAEVVQFRPKAGARVVPLPLPRAVSLDGRRGLGVRRDGQAWRIKEEDGGGPEAA
jgi:hypothetical protein